MKSFIYISVAVLFACFNATKFLVSDENTDIKMHSKTSSYCDLFDTEQDLLLNYCDSDSSVGSDHQNLSTNICKHASDLIKGKTSKLFCRVSPKLNPLTIDIPPPVMAI